MPDVVWDDAFEASPADTDEAKYGAQKIRQLKVAIRERGELELNWKAGTRPFGKAGRIAVMFAGTTAEINALTSVSAGALAWDTSLNVIKGYSGSAWVILQPDHGYLVGLSDDDHTQYLHLNKADQTLQQNLAVASGKTIDGRDISVDGAKLDALGVTLKCLATPVNKVNWTAITDWTDVDISSDTGSDTAKAALLQATLSFSQSSYGSQVVLTGYFRKNGSSQTSNLPRLPATLFASSLTTQPYVINGAMFIVECDSNEVFETKLEQTSGVHYTNISYRVDLIGYFV